MFLHRCDAELYNGLMEGVIEEGDWFETATTGSRVVWEEHKQTCL